MKTALLFCVSLSVVSCFSGAGFETSYQIDPELLNPAPPIFNENRDLPDLGSGEEVETVLPTLSGYKVRAVIGELVEDTTTAQGWQVRGVFHE